MTILTADMTDLLQSVLDAPADSSVGELRDSEARRLGISTEEAAQLIVDRLGAQVDAVIIPDDPQA